MDLPKLRIFPLIALAALVAASCSQTATPTVIISDTPAGSQNGVPLTEAEVPRVSVEEAAAAIQSGEAVVLDVRSPEAYQAGHIPGALSVPLGEIETNAAGLNLGEEKWIITYCT